MSSRSSESRAVDEQPDEQETHPDRSLLVACLTVFSLVGNRVVLLHRAPGFSGQQRSEIPKDISLA
jgi:hypothetical protein